MFEGINKNCIADKSTSQADYGRIMQTKYCGYTQEGRTLKVNPVGTMSSNTSFEFMIFKLNIATNCGYIHDIDFLESDRINDVLRITNIDYSITI